LAKLPTEMMNGWNSMKITTKKVKTRKRATNKNRVRIGMTNLLKDKTKPKKKTWRSSSTSSMKMQN